MIPLELLLPLVIVAGDDDCYFPALAVPLLAGLRGLSEEDGRVTITLAAYEAAAELMRN